MKTRSSTVCGLRSQKLDSERDVHLSLKPSSCALLLDQLGEKGIGLLITVDEVKVTVPEMKELARVYQRFVREGRNVALLMAGLPHSVSGLLNDEDVSFLRRARKHSLARIPDREIREAVALTVERRVEPLMGTDSMLPSRRLTGSPI